MLHLEIVTPEKKIFSDTVENVYLPSSEGEMGVLEMHAALVTPIQPGELRYLKDGKVEELAVGEGFVEAGGHRQVHRPAQGEAAPPQGLGGRFSLGYHRASTLCIIADSGTTPTVDIEGHRDETFMNRD